MAGLRNDQIELNLDTIYKLEDIHKNFTFNSKNLFILATDGTGNVNIYTSEETPANKTEMILEHVNISGHKSFVTVPNYIYIEQAVATVSSVILTGIKATSL